MIITKIEQQKKNSKRYSLFSGEKFITGISDETLIEFAIHQGMQLSEKTLEKIREKENNLAVREQAWRFLARREHSRKELSDKLIRKNFAPALITNVIEDLTAKDYLNDDRFARQLINEEIDLKKNGMRLIKGNLLKKGIESTLADELLHECYAEEVQIENCRYLAGKKIKSLAHLEADQQKKRLADYLNRKGFTWELISRMIGELFSS